MDNTNKQTDNTTQGGTTTAQSNTATAQRCGTGASGNTSSGASCLASLPGMKAEVATWVQFMRRPGMVLSMDIQKRHVCDMDAEAASGTQGNGSSPSQSGGSNAENSEASGSCASGESSCPSGGNSSGGDPSAFDKSGVNRKQGGNTTCSCGGTVGQPGVMCYREVCRVRYFDLAVGAMVMLLVGGMIRAMCGCMKKLR